MSPNRRIFLNIVATYGRSLYALVCGLFTARWALSALGKTDFGLYGVVGGLAAFISFINFLLSFATGRFFAFAEGRAKKMSNDGDASAGIEECRAWFSTSLMLHLVVSIVLISVGYPVGMHAVEHWLTIPPDRLDACRWVFKCVCVTCFASMVNVPCHAMYTAKQYIAELTLYSFLQTTANVIFIYFMVTHPGDWLARYALWMCIVAVVPQLLIAIRAFRVFEECRFRLAYAWNINRVVQLTKFAFWLSLTGLGSILRGQGLQILVNKYFCPAYNASMTIANQVAGHSQTLAGAMQGAFSPAITAACGAGLMDEMRRMAYRTCKFGVLLSLAFMLPLSLELPMVLKLWLINPPPCAAGLCWCILISAVLDKSAWGHLLAVEAVGKIAMYHAFVGGCTAFTLPLGWFFVANNKGFLSLGYAIVIAMGLCVLGRVWFARSLVGMSARYWLLQMMTPIFLVVLFSFSIGTFLKVIMPATFLRLCATTIVCEISFLPLVWRYVLDTNEKQYLWERLRKFVARLKV